MGWTTIETPNATPWTPEEGESIEGTYMGFHTIAGNNGDFRSYRVLTDEGTILGLTGAMLSQSFERIPNGAKIRVEYKGMITLKNKRQAKDFEVQVDDSVKLLPPASSGGNDDALPFDNRA